MSSATSSTGISSVLSAALSALLYGISMHAAPAKPVPTAIVATYEGPVRGYQTPGVDVFLGIPFAAPPIGELRWRPPAPPVPWVKPLDAVAFGGRCVQTNTFGVFAAPSENEDCLYLNVYAPHLATSPANRARPNGQTLRPVMVWIYGGGFFDGESDDYDGTRLAIEGDVIVVTINYRVNVFGFLGHPALDAEGHAAVNYGLMDQQAALRWVQRNIRAFGGNPDNVTIFGESAGGSSVLFQLASPAAAGLFHRGIAHSPAFVPAQATLTEAEARGHQFAEALGCSDQSAGCLRSRSVKDIIAHITWYEREMTGVIEARALVGSELWSVPLDERNEAIYRENKDRPLAEVLDEARQVHDRLMHQLESLSEQDLQDPGRFAEMPSDWKPWAVIASNTYEHYQHHVLQVSTWLANRVSNSLMIAR